LELWRDLVLYAYRRYDICDDCLVLPFDDDSVPKLIDKIILAQFEFPAFVSPGAKDLIQSILTPNPNKRPTLEQIKGHPWLKGDSTVPASVSVDVRALFKKGSKELSDATPEEYTPTKLASCFIPISGLMLLSL
jgi:serine/threonine protein kinase